VLLLSGARVLEVADMRWPELNFADRIWTLPAARNKARVDLERPLGPMAWEILARQPRVEGCEFIFGRSRNSGPMKRQLDDAAHINEPWRLHDLRRVARSLLSRGRVQSDIAEMLLGHLLTGQRKIYDRHQYIDEKRSAYEVLEREIDLIINPPEAAVLPFRR